MGCRRDLERMRRPADVLSSEEVARLRHEAEAELEGQRAVAQARKEKMLKVLHLPLTASNTHLSLVCCLRCRAVARVLRTFKIFAVFFLSGSTLSDSGNAAGVQLAFSNLSEPLAGTCELVQQPSCLLCQAPHHKAQDATAHRSV